MVHWTMSFPLVTTLKIKHGQMLYQDLLWNRSRLIFHVNLLLSPQAPLTLSILPEMSPIFAQRQLKRDTSSYMALFQHG